MKNLNLNKIFFLFFIVFISSSIAQTKMQSGIWSVNPSLEDYSLDKNEGERSMTIEVSFKTPFKTKPQIAISITQLDCDKESNLRYNVEVLAASRDGFTLKVNTWADSKIFSISGYWIACTE
jgi:hypothetical protein